MFFNKTSEGVYALATHMVPPIVRVSAPVRLTKILTFNGICLYCSRTIGLTKRDRHSKRMASMQLSKSIVLCPVLLAQPPAAP